MTFVTGRPVFAKKSFAPFHQVVNNLADEFLNRSISDFIGHDALHTQPSVNIIDTETAFLIELAAPGLQKDAFKIELEKNQLIVSAQKPAADETQKTLKYMRREFTFATFKRSFQLPENIAIDNIGAQYENGILTLTLPKKVVEAPVNKHITVS
jgi:HSP20 family protein